jgi:hypothetical protein
MYPINMKKKCEVEGCGRDRYARELCKRHDQRLRRGGDPHAPLPEMVPLEERFKAKLAPKDPVTGCIEWVGKGEGQVRAHRLAYELKHGPIPPGMKVCHTCDNPPCCNPDHLCLGTQADNIADRDAKGRQAKGENNGFSKLTEADVTEIRRRLANSEVQRKIAKDFGITPTAVGYIKNGRNWKHQQP